MNKRISTPAHAVVSIRDITPSDSEQILDEAGAAPTNLMLCESKTLTIEDLSGAVTTFPPGALAVGVFHRIAVRKILATGTDGTFGAGMIKVGWDS